MPESRLAAKTGPLTGATPSPLSPSRLVRAGRLFVICMGPGLGGLAPLALSVDQPALAAHFGGGDDGRLIARLLFSVPSLAIMVGAPLAGWLAERIGYRAVLLASLLTYGIAGPAGLVLDGYWPLLISRLVLGLAAGGAMAMYMALAATYYDGVARARVIGFAVATSALVGLIAFLIGGILVDRAGWRGPFLLYLIGLVAFVVAWATVRGPFHIAGRGARASTGETLRMVARLWPVYLVLITLSIGTFTPTAGGPFLLKANGISGAGDQGLLLAIGAVPAIVTGSCYGLLRRRFGDHALLIATGLLMGAGVILLVLLHGRLAIVTTLVLLNFGAGLKAPAVATVLMAEASESTRGTVSGLNSSGIFLAQFLAPMLLEFLGRPFGMEGAFLVIGGALLGIAAFVAIRGIGGAHKEEVTA